MKNFENYLQQQQYSRTSIKEYIRTANEFIIWLETENLDVKQTAYTDVMAYIKHLQNKGVKPNSINTRLNSLRIYFNYLIQIKQLSKNPAFKLRIKGIKKQEVMEVLSEAQLDELYKIFLSHKPNNLTYRHYHLQYTIALGLMMYQGINTSILKKLLLTDFNLQEGTVFISAGNTYNERILTLQSKQIVPLLNYLNTTTGEYFIKQGAQSFQSLLEKRIVKLYGKSISVRQIINSRIVLWLKEEPIRKVQYLTGMRYISSLNKYQKQNVDGLKKMVEKFHPLG